MLIQIIRDQIQAQFTGLSDLCLRYVYMKLGQSQIEATLFDHCSFYIGWLKSMQMEMQLYLCLNTSRFHLIINQYCSAMTSNRSKQFSFRLHVNIW